MSDTPATSAGQDQKSESSPVPESKNLAQPSPPQAASQPPQQVSDSSPTPAPQSATQSQPQPSQQPQPAKQTDQKQEAPQTQQTSGSWGGWWGWGQSVVMQTVTTATNTLKEVNTAYVQPTVDTVSKTTTKIVNDLATAIDVPEGSAAPTSTASSGAAPASSTSDASTPSGTPQATQAPEDSILKYIDSGVSLLASGADYLTKNVTSTVSNTVETLANTDISTVVNSSKNLLDSSVNAANKSLDMLEHGLEKVGTTAMSLLTEEYSASNPRRKPRFFIDGESDTTGSDSPSKEKAKSPFEEFGGKISKETLETVAVEALRKQQLLFRKLSPEQAQKVNDATASVQEVFDKEKHEENQAKPPTFVVGESETSQLNALFASFSSTKEAVKAKSATAVSEFTEFVKSKTDQKPENVAEYIATKQKALREECLSTLSKLSAEAVKQLLNFGQWHMVASSTSTPPTAPSSTGTSPAGTTPATPSPTLSKDQLVQLATTICQLCEYLEQELTTITTLYVDAIQSLSLKGGESLAAMIASGASAEHVQGVKKQINMKTQGMRNLVYFDVGTETSHIQDSKRFLQNIVKFITIINTEDKLKEEVAKI